MAATMQIDKFIRPSVGADLSRPQPIDRPSYASISRNGVGYSVGARADEGWMGGPSWSPVLGRRSCSSKLGARATGCGRPCRPSQTHLIFLVSSDTPACCIY